MKVATQVTVSGIVVGRPACDGGEVIHQVRFQAGALRPQDRRAPRNHPESYLRNVLSRIADHPIKRIEELLPWNVAASLQLPNQEAA